MTVGGSALEDFTHRCHALLDDIDAADASLVLDDDTWSLANLVASRLEIIASSFEDMLGAAASAGASMTDELEDMLSQLTTDDVDELNAPLVVGEPCPVISPEKIAVSSEWSFDVSRPQSNTSLRSSKTPSLVSDWSSDGSDSEDEAVLNISLLAKRCFEGTMAGKDETAREHKRRRSFTLSPITPPLARAWDAEDNSSLGTTIDGRDDVHCRTDGGHLHASRNIRSLPSRKTVASPSDSNRHCVAQSRKRRLSDADADRPTKRPCNLHIEPRRQVVSNPLPVADNDLEDQSFNVDCWATQFTVVDPATFAPPDTTIPLEFDYTGWSRAPTKTFVEPVAFEFAAMAVDPPFDEVLGEVCFSSDHDVVPTTSSDVMKAVEGETAPCLDVATESQSLSRPDSGTSSNAEKTVQTLSLPPAEALECIRPASTESNLPVSAPSPTPDAVAQSVIDPAALTPLLDHAADCASSVVVKRSRSRSSSLSRTPPPSFESVTTSLCADRDPPSYSVFDLFPEFTTEAPPPPYCLSPQVKPSPLLHKASDVGALVTDLFPLAFTKKKHEFTDAFHQRVQAPQAGLAIAV